MRLRERRKALMRCCTKQKHRGPAHARLWNRKELRAGRAVPAHEGEELSSACAWTHVFASGTDSRAAGSHMPGG